LGFILTEKWTPHRRLFRPGENNGQSRSDRLARAAGALLDINIVHRFFWVI
jgi:hypothetical protein